MFETSVYVERRARLAREVGTGLVLLPGHGESPINYLDNAYPFRQDSSFLYFIGIDQPFLAAIIDCEAGTSILYGDEATLDDVIWTGPQPSLAETAARAGLDGVRARDDLVDALAEARRLDRRLHVLPPYRGETTLLLSTLLGVAPDTLSAMTSLPLIRAVVAQRVIKSPAEVAEIEAALETTREMQMLAMRLAQPGVVEREVAGAMEGVAIARGGRLAFPIIFSRRGETLHNHSYGNRLEAGDLVVSDCGAESANHYAGDTTRTLSVGRPPSGVRRDLYEAVLRAQQVALDLVRPGTTFLDVHLAAARSLAADLSALGCIRGDIAEAVSAGAHALFFPHGLGHAMGLDVHDMEHLGEDQVGYDDTITRSSQFGLKSLRFARRLAPGMVVTVEPGLYFIPALIDRWRAEGRAAAFIDYDAVDRLRAAGGIRIEDDVVVTDDGCRVLGPPIPKAIDDVAAASAG